MIQVGSVQMYVTSDTLPPYYTDMVSKDNAHVQAAIPHQTP